MHNAPSVSYPTGRSAVHAGLLAGAWLAGAATIGLWCASVDVLAWRQWLGLGALLPAAWLALASWRSVRPGELRWTGQAWLWAGLRQDALDAVEGQLSVHLDWQRGLLLRFQPVVREPAMWLWMGQGAHPARWRALRRAVYSPARMHANLMPDAQSMDSPAKP